MKEEHQIVREVDAAKTDAGSEEQLILKYLPYIKAVTSKCVRRAVDESDDEVSIAMLAFHEAVKGYRKEKGAFLSYASTVIKSRIIDYSRKERRHSGNLSFNGGAYGQEDGLRLNKALQFGRDDMEEYNLRLAAKEEICDFSKQLLSFGLQLDDIVNNCPKQERTLKACHQALSYAKKEKTLLEFFLRNQKIPLKQLAQGAGVERKTLERHRNYMAALLLAYTNGFEIIRGHVSQILPDERRGV